MQTPSPRMNSQTLIFRCDADPAIGIGHVMRCLALAEAWQDSGGRAVFAVSELPSGLETRLSAEGIELIRLEVDRGSEADAITTVQTAREIAAQWAVVDGDAFDVEFLRVLKESELRVLLIDDFASRASFPADLILNSNLGASEQAYRKKAAHIPVLIGPDYLPLRREFTWHGFDREFPECAHRVLVSPGGSDPENLSPQIAHALRDLEDLRLTVVAGASYEHWDDLRQLSTVNVNIVSNPPDMHELMRRSDLAISAAGGTLWELLYSGCAVMSYARNPVQARVVELVAQRGAAWNLGDTRDFHAAPLRDAVQRLAADRELRKAMANAGRSLIDGKGAERVIAAIRMAI
jgi:UDP-2,4-diacetamido-2,4,6-trideoxy-beta-L-altropyranose hydrolase